MHALKEFILLFKQQVTAIGRQGSLASNITWVFSGKFLTSIAGFLLMPILANILDQEAFGVFGVLNHFISICAVLVGLLLSNAFILDISQSEFLKLRRVVYTNIVILCGILMALLIPFGGFLFESLGINPPMWVRFIIAPLVLIYAFKNTQADTLRRINAFRDAAIVNSGMDIGSRILAIGLGLWVTQTFVALLAKELVRMAFTFIIAYRKIISKVEYLRSFSFASMAEIKDVLKTYQRFPKFEMTGALAGMLYGSLPLYFLGSAYGVNSIGDYTMVQSLLVLPAFVMTNSVVSVVQREAAQQLNTAIHKLRTMIAYSVSGMNLIATFGMGLIFWYGEEIFSFFLGSQWSTAGEMGSILAPFFILRMSAPILESLRVILGTQQYNLLFRVTGVVSAATILYVGIQQGMELNNLLHVFTVANCMLLLISMTCVLIKLKSNLTLIFGSILLTSSIGLGLSYLVGLPFVG